MLFFFIFMDEFINYYIALLIIIQKKTKNNICYNCISNHTSLKSFKTDSNTLMMNYCLI